MNILDLMLGIATHGPLRQPLGMARKVSPRRKVMKPVPHRRQSSRCLGSRLPISTDDLISQLGE